MGPTPPHISLSLVGNWQHGFKCKVLLSNNFPLNLVCNYNWTYKILWLRGGSQKKLRKFGHTSKLGLPYLPRSLVWTKKSLDKYSYCLPYLPIQKVWTFLNWRLPLNVYFLTFVRILLVNNHARYHQGHLWIKDLLRDDLKYKEIS